MDDIPVFLQKQWDAMDPIELRREVRRLYLQVKKKDAKIAEYRSLAALLRDFLNVEEIRDPRND